MRERQGDKSKNNKNSSNNSGITSKWLYLCQVEQFLMECPGRTKRKLMDGLGQEIEEFLLQSLDGKYENLEEIFGQPEQIAQQLLDTVPLRERRAAWEKRRMWALTIIAILLAIVIQMGIMLWRERAEKGMIREVIYVAQPYYVPDVPDDPVERGF